MEREKEAGIIIRLI